MTDSYFNEIARTLEAWPEVPSRGGVLPTPYQRLLDAVCLSMVRPGSVGPRDLVALTRQVLRHETHAQGADQHLLVPGAADWPTIEHWHAADCAALPAAGGKLIVGASAWNPPWNCNQPVISSAEAAFGRRPDMRVAGDPFLADILGPEFTSYSSPGQRQAIRTVLAARDSATIVVNLPTGTGKSAVAVAPGLLQSAAGGVSVVVVPTTSLALDQERAVRAYLARSEPDRDHPARFAYIGSQADSEHANIRAAIRDGTQRLVFVSPESLLTSLAPSVYAAAANGYMRYFVIDEAHIVASWGVEFRPEFQALSGFRRDLLRVATAAGQSGFRTIVMSATITADVVDTLAVLFGEPGPVEYVGSVFVRPEPEYWVHACESADERIGLVVEAVRHLPRPAVIYVSRRADARFVAESLLADGNMRIAMVTGDTSPEQRGRIIEQWRGESFAPELSTHVSDVDVVVGTSAFGLGVDQADVRSVLHACIPESIDRYYQEVGRGGRDGRASAAVMLHAPSDLDVAERLSTNRIIGVELGLQRWAAMLQSAQSLGANRYRVSLDTRRSAIYQDSRENEAWNLRTIALMMRAGLIHADSEPPPATDDTTEDEAADAFRRYITSAVLEVTDPGHLDPGVWNAVVEPARRQTIRATASAYSLMVEALYHKRDFADIFAEAYRIGPASSLGVCGETLPQRGCGGCPHCRKVGQDPYAGQAGSPEPVAEPRSLVSQVLCEIAGSPAGNLIVLIDPRPMRRRHRWPEFAELLTALVRHGIRLLSAPPAVQGLATVTTAHRATRDGFLFLEPNPAHIFAPKVPTLIVHDPLHRQPLVPESYFRAPSTPYLRVVLVPPDARDPERPDHLVAETRHPNLDADTLLAML